MWKYEVPWKMCRGTYVAINKLITKSSIKLQKYLKRMMPYMPA